jgi:osmotically-inducible protein OsmY
MKMHSSAVGASFVILILGTGGISAVRAQGVAVPAKPGPQAANVARELQVLTALRSHPLTAGYPIMATWSKGAVVLSGGVGTKEAHDVAVRLAIATGVPFRDNIVIDTGLAHATAIGAGGTIGMSGFATLGASSPYIYPPPLMGRLDDPFFGFVPPLVSFPPWWRQRFGAPAMPRPGPLAANAAPGAQAPQGVGAGQNGANAPAAVWQPLDVAPVKGQVEVTVDASGQVFLRGVVASEEAGREIEEAARSVPGVSRVDVQFQVMPRVGGAGQNPPPREGDMVEPRRAGPENPPPPPEPVLEPEEPERRPAAVRPKPAATGPSGLDKSDLTRRIVAALSRRELLALLPIKVRSGDGTVTLTGRVPTALEAMNVFRATQQTPGVKEVVDRMEFEVPDEDHPNPLLQKGRPEDLEAYLVSQIRRHIGDLAHIDRVETRGAAIDIRGTLAEGQDRDRLLAILRSIPVLHGFRIEADLTAE